MTDDMGTGDAGFSGAVDDPTPRIDALSREGLVFDEAYTIAPSCTCARGALLTGRDPRRFGIDRSLAGASTHGLPPTETTVAEVLRRAGWHTGLVGKWHLGLQPEYSPLGFGFEYFLGMRGGRISYETFTDGPREDFWCGEERLEARGYSTDVFASSAEEFVRDHLRERFFLYLPFNAPHEDDHGRVPAPERIMQGLRAGGREPSTREVYRGAITAVDEGVGGLYDLIRNSGLADRTLFLFLSDQGASLERRGTNGELRGGKLGCPSPRGA